MTSTDVDIMLKFVLRSDVPVKTCVQNVCVIMLRSTEQFLIVCFCLSSHEPIEAGQECQFRK